MWWEADNPITLLLLLYICQKPFFFFLVDIVKINIPVAGKEGAVCRLVLRDLQSVRCGIASPLHWLQSWSCCLHVLGLYT